MYTDEQKKSHIMELQRYLHGLNMHKGNEPAVIPDGVYGERTTAAVSLFQRENGIPVTGKTDSETWDAIVNEYVRKMNDIPSAVNIFPSADYICGMGCGGVIVWVIQYMLSELAKRYDNMAEIGVNGDYTAEMAAAVRVFQRICGVNITGDVNCETWNLLIGCYEHKLL